MQNFFPFLILGYSLTEICHELSLKSCKIENGLIHLFFLTLLLRNLRKFATNRNPNERQSHIHEKFLVR